MPNEPTEASGAPLPGEVGVKVLIESCDWAASELGERPAWAEPLQTIVRLILDSKTPQFVAWGPQLCLLYNDAYLTILGDKHPAALGRPLATVWTDLWPDIRDAVRRVMAGEPLRFENAPFVLWRNGKNEQA